MSYMIIATKPCMDIGIINKRCPNCMIVIVAVSIFVGE